jgi:signal transduction histidine kinase
VEDLGIRSAILAPFEGEPGRRGVLLVSSTQIGAFEEGGVEFACAVARWVSLVAHRADLADEIALRAREEGRRAAADELVTVLAHDFRNYLQPIAARFELIRRRAAREGRVRDRDDVDAALSSVRRLVRLVEDLLDIARLDAGLMELERRPLDLVALVRETAQALEVTGRPIIVAAPPRLPVEGDPARLRQVLDNLLANAAKHAPPGTQVEIHVDVLDASRASVRISDRGPGVSPDVLPTLFQRFGRGRGSTGLGLGLYLAHEITERHGGSLTVDSQPGRGTTFTLALPSQTSAA